MVFVFVFFVFGMLDIISIGVIGLVFVNLIGFNKILMLLVDQWMELEIFFGVIVRLKWFYMNIFDENKLDEKEELLVVWFFKGGIEICNVCVLYSDDLLFVFKDLNFKIEFGQKVGVCGCFGSGKLSLVFILF